MDVCLGPHVEVCVLVWVLWLFHSPLECGSTTVTLDWSRYPGHFSISVDTSLENVTKSDH